MRKIVAVCYNQKDNIVYLPAPKNCYTFFRDELFKHKWQEIAVEKGIGPETKLFSHSRNPRERFIKGITQILYACYVPIEGANEENLEKILEKDNPLEYFALYNDKLLTSFNDVHITPIVNYLDKYITRITFIPVDHPQYTCNELTNIYFKENNIDIKISELTRKANKSTKNKLRVYELVKQDIANREIFYKEHIEPKLKMDIEIHNKSLLMI